MQGDAPKENGVTQFRFQYFRVGHSNSFDAYFEYVDIGNNAEAFLPRRESIAKEAIRPQDRIKAVLKDINDDLKGPPLILSRVSPNFLVELFKIEVPEINQNLIELIIIFLRKFIYILHF